MRWLSHRVLRILGWQFLGVLPDDPKMVIVGAPHTSNWDFVLFLAALHHWQMHVRFLGKHTLFRWPLGRLFRALGGIPVDRRRPEGVVRQVKEAFDREERLTLVIAPEGTRRAAPRWKSGFLEIAEQAGVRIVPAKIDARRRTITLGPPLAVGSGRKALMDELRVFFAEANGLHAEGAGPVRISGETES